MSDKKNDSDHKKKQPTHRSSNELFSALYGKNISPDLMIKAFSKIIIYFRCFESAIFLDFYGKIYSFPLPAKSDLPPAGGVGELCQSEMKELFDAITSGGGSEAHAIINTAFRKAPSSNASDSIWSLLFWCNMQPSSMGLAKRSTGEIRLLLLNNGHAEGCLYSPLMRKQEKGKVVTRTADEDHDLIAVYAAYFDQMLRDLSFVPMPLIEAEWNKALQDRSQIEIGEARHRAGLPWGERAPEETPTVTLSLDLRNSTFAMLQARDRSGVYAKWLEGLAELARAITLHNGGIFDKFTGDGIICHFVYPMKTGDGDLGERQALIAGITCATELIRALEVHISSVEPHLKFRSRTFGPAIGMAVDLAAWSLDRDGKPVVVGEGIVNACRLNKGERGSIILTNDLKHRLVKFAAGLRFVEHDVGDNHKEISAKIEASCWRLLSNIYPELGRSDEDLKNLVENVHGDIKSRYADCDSNDG